MRPRRLVPAVLGSGGLAVVGVYGAQAAQFRKQAGKPFRLSPAAAPGTPGFTRWVEAACAAPLRKGNQVQVLHHGPEILSSMLGAIADATQTIDLANYIFWKGEAPTSFAEALAARARAGVEVNVLLDGWGSAPADKELVTTMEQAGATVAWFRPPHWYNLHRFNNRMHRRTLVIDGKLGFVGGVGIADEWTEDGGDWRDTHLRIQGDAVRDVLGAFMDNWIEATERVLPDRHAPELPRFDDGVPVQVTRSSPEKGPTKGESLFFAAVLGARDRLWFTTAYFAPRRALVDALVAVAGRGIDVRMVVNGSDHMDKELVRRAGHRSYDRLLDAGVRIFEYQRAMMHAKVLLVDAAWANVGTANWDNRSLALQDEVNCSLTDAGIVAELEKQFRDDFDGSEEVDLGRWRSRPLGARAYELGSELLRHSL